MRQNVFRIAACNGKLAIAEFLLPFVDPGWNDNIALRCASQLGETMMIQFLLKQPTVDPSSFHNSALVASITNRKYNAVKVLLNDIRVDPTDSELGKEDQILRDSYVFGLGVW